MRRIVVLVVCAATFWVATLSAQFQPPPKYQTALETAEEQRKQGKLLEALETLQAIDSTELEPQKENDDGEFDEIIELPPDNEFLFTFSREDRGYGYRNTPKDKALELLVDTFLEKRQYDNAVTAAQSIVRCGLQSYTLLRIVEYLCQAVDENSKEFDQLMAQANKTADLLDDAWHDAGCYRGNHQNRSAAYKQIGDKYFSACRYDLAAAAFTEMQAERWRDLCLSVAVREFGRRGHEKTPENEKIIRILIAPITSPLLKADALCSLAHFYDRNVPCVPGVNMFDAAESRRKRLAVLREATEILIPYPDKMEGHGDLDKPHYMQKIYRSYNRDEMEAEAGPLRKALFESVANYEFDGARFHHYMMMFFYLPEDPSHPDEAVAADLYEKLTLIAAQAENAWTRAQYWQQLWLLRQQRSSYPRTAQRQEAFHAARQAVSEIDEPVWRTERLRELIENTRKEEAVALLGTLEKVAESKNGVHLFDEMFLLAQRHLLWDTQKTTKYLKRYESVIAGTPDPAERFKSHWILLTSASFLSDDEAAQRDRLDRLHRAVKEIPSDSPHSRLNAYCRTVQQAVDAKLPDLARKIVEEALDYAKSLSPEEGPPYWLNSPRSKLERFHKEITK